ncbi:hypothetical protein VTJ04DRAFT_7081 [Mycothermus thermophilus]|uniref:uncharacterized protein n=1 Tax=Humicola insolens TaxID=85995 RepID=UPI003744ABCF
MDDQARAAYEEQCLQLRAELKTWEGNWAAAHGGSKPGRADIKQNPDIAQKYKQYNKLRDILSGKIPPPKQAPVSPAEDASKSHPRKRNQADAALEPQTPSKKFRHVQTPQKARHIHVDAAPTTVQTPMPAHSTMTPSANRTSLTPAEALPTSISPTPHKDGRVLGLFDLLGRTPSQHGTATPSKHDGLLPQPLPVAATPSTSRFASATTPHSTRRTTTTAAANGQLLFKPTSATPRKKNTTTTPFKTPSTNRVSKPTASTPSSATPSFLRRRTVFASSSNINRGGLARVDEQDENAYYDDDEEPVWKKVGPLRLPRKLTGMAKGLSSMVAGLRKMEDEAYVDDEEALREMEMGGGSNGQNQKAGGEAKKEKKDGGEVQPGDNKPAIEAPEKPDRPIGLLSAFDDESLFDSPDEEAQQGQPLRQFKKRGQKRTTRLVKMRPTRAKRPANVEKDEDSVSDDEKETVPETQLALSNKPGNNAKPGEDLRVSNDEGSAAEDASDDDGASEYDGSDADQQDEEDDKDGKPAAKQPKSKSSNTNKEKESKADADKKDGEGVVKRAVRKVKATAHANFRRLKLRNTGSKGGPGYNSRFRRRR